MKTAVGLHYYNDNDHYCAQWLQALTAAGQIPAGKVDQRDIQEISSSDLGNCVQAHFFAGIGGWPLALQLAGWPADRPVWTGSAPCQPFSRAGRKRGFADERHLWPSMLRLIGECRPATILGEQVAAAVEWLAIVKRDLEALGYAVGAIPITAACVGAPHKRERVFFVAHALDHGFAAVPFQRQPVASVHNHPAGTKRAIRPARSSGGALRVPPMATRSRSGRSPWLRKPGICTVANGVPVCMAQIRAFGNAIVPQVAAEFIKAVM